MPAADYFRILSHTKELLRPFFDRVESAIDAPEKLDHGDLDVLALRAADRPLPQVEEIARVVHADNYEKLPNDLICLALPWLDKDMKPVPGQYVQLDLRIWTSHEQLDWSLFTQCNGDMINILAALIKHKGITITDQALNVRIPEIEKHNKKAARVELTRNPKVVLQYLELDPQRFFQPFDTREELMTYMASCRFHDPTRINRSVYETNAESVHETTKSTLNNYDYERSLERPMFRYWYQEFIPNHRDMPRGRSACLSRAETLEDVFQFFGEKARDKYYEQKARHLVAIAKPAVFATIRENLRHRVAQENIDDTIKGVRKLATGQIEDTSGIEPAKLYNDDDFDGVIRWAEQNHATALRVYRAWLHEAHKNLVKDPAKAAPFSTKPLETYSPDEDRIILDLKQEETSWPDILKAINKKSKSQLVAHWKKDLAVRVKPKEN